MRLEDMDGSAVAQLPDGSHILYVTGVAEDSSDSKIFYKIVRSPLDLLKGEWQQVPDDIREQK